MAGKRLVDGVVHHLVDHMVKPRPVIRIADIHAGALSHRIQAFQNLDGIRTVIRATILLGRGVV